MGKKKQSELRRAENEVIFREHNERIGDQVNGLLPQEDKSTFLVGFVCECSDENCQERIEMPLDQFQRLRKHEMQFIIQPHHEQFDIEQIIEKHPDFNLVEKYELPPTTDGVLNRT